MRMCMWRGRRAKIFQCEQMRSRKGMGVVIFFITTQNDNDLACQRQLELAALLQSQRPKAMHEALTRELTIVSQLAVAFAWAQLRLGGPQELVESCRTASFESLERTTAVDESPRQPSRAPNSRGNSTDLRRERASKVFF